MQLTCILESLQIFQRELEMAKLQITTKDERTKELLIDLLHTMKGVEVKESKQTTRNPKDAFQQLCGIWKDRDANLGDIREKAWRRGAK